MRATTPRSASPTSGTRSRPGADLNGVRARARSLARRARGGAHRREGPHRARARARDEGRRPAHPQRGVVGLRRLAHRSRARQLARCRGGAAPHDVLRVVGRDRRRRHRPADRLRVRRRAHARRSRPRLGSARRGHARVPPARRAPDPGPAHPGDPRSARDPFGARRAVERVQRRVGAEGPVAVRRVAPASRSARPA